MPRKTFGWGGGSSKRLETPTCGDRFITWTLHKIEITGGEGGFRINTHEGDGNVRELWTPSVASGDGHVSEWNGIMMEWHWQRKASKMLMEKSVTMPFFTPRISHELVCDWTCSSMVRGHQLTAWAMACPGR
jgi:hypothetical protein